MRFKLDENVPTELADLLGSYGHETETLVKERLRPSTFKALTILAVAATSGFLLAEPLLCPAPAQFTQQKAERMEKAARTTLAPVYAPLAEQLVADLELADREGIGIDLGSGPGTLIIELCRRTRLHWINADINPHFFPGFVKAAGDAGLSGRISAVFADAQALPFRNDYAEVVVSRGSFHLWGDQRRGFAEVYRVLKPGGVAYIGRGFSGNLPVDVAREIRARQKQGSGPPPYDLDETEQTFRAIMASLGIDHYTVHRPSPPGSEGINYGIWIEIHKDEAARERQKNE